MSRFKYSFSALRAPSTRIRRCAVQAQQRLLSVLRDSHDGAQSISQLRLTS